MASTGIPLQRILAVAVGVVLLLCHLQEGYGAVAAAGTSQSGLSISTRGISSSVPFSTSHARAATSTASSSLLTTSLTVSAVSSSASYSASTVFPSIHIHSTATSRSASATVSSGPSGPTQSLDPGTASDIATVLDRRLSIIIEAVGSAANLSTWLSTLGADGKWPESEIDYTTGCTARRANWPAEDHWTRISIMAAAWHGGLADASNYKNDSSLLDAISRAMDYWFVNDFTNPSCLDQGGLSTCPCGTPGFWNTNWFSNIIGIPELVGESCNLLGAANMTPTQLSNCSNILDRAFGTFGRSVNGLGFLTGANTLDVAKIGIDSGLLTNNATLVTAGYLRIHREVVVQNATRADGIREDGSFGQHGGIIYNGNYGKDYTNDVLALEIAAAGTQFSAQNANTSSQAAFETLLGGDLWMVYRNVITGVQHWDFSVLPRFITFPVSDNQATASLKINISQIQELGNLWGSETIQSVYNSLAVNSWTANSGDIIGNRMFYDNDYMVQRGRGYVSTLRMYSARTSNTECVNSQNPFGFHLSDGTLYTYLQGDEYEDIAAAWDWNLIPGTTLDYNATPLSCNFTEWNGTQAFVGGVSDGSVGAAAMRYTNPYTGSLSFQKAWFFLDDDVQHIMISYAESNSSSANPVVSVIDQKRLNGNVYVNGRALRQGGNFSYVESLWHDGVGYTFDHGLLDSRSDLAVDFGARSGDWAAIGVSTAGNITVDLFSAWINHGSGNRLDVPIAYTAYPATTFKIFERKRADTQLLSIRNDQSVSAAYDTKHRTAMIVFWDVLGGSITFVPGLLDAPITIQASANSAVIYKLDDGNVTVSDPSQTFSTLNLAIQVGLLGRRPKGWGSERTRTISFTLPGGGMAGSSVTKAL
ncbi:polysaccharide lyase family 8 protein [Dichomitus squalens LYAD-421 SS1]|uniref:Polysaccharide lyase family 8 protein n=1 Tax=Dichomitus squalens (strain LYAD-421) TaxID=732165 RepID=R7T0J5_DICSQ|nr:polysaccharide lyase family 8 protein [Dichomitus squalens LYAD-421 SS1]EJF60682.1 polysaccharide lyase family 8 protein [Dichomitus squalens LYAD-421 SS1]